MHKGTLLLFDRLNIWFVHLVLLEMLTIVTEDGVTNFSQCALCKQLDTFDWRLVALHFLLISSFSNKA